MNKLYLMVHSLMLQWKGFNRVGVKRIGKAYENKEAMKINRFAIETVTSAYVLKFVEELCPKI